MSRPALSTRARKALDDAEIPVRSRVLVACSGGLDSQVLLDVLAHVARSKRIEIVAHGVDHGLRAAAKRELSLAERLAEARGVPFGRSRIALADGSNLQARARAARWGALAKAASEAGADFIATGHHADDRAETVLIRILRGAPLDALAVLPVRSNERIRPLISARKSELRDHAASRSIRFADDPSNHDRRHLRVRVRRDVLPLLAELDPRIVEHLCALAARASSIAAVAAASAAAAGDFAEIPTEALRASSRAVAALREAAARKNVRARVPLGHGRIGRWDESLGVVISSSSGLSGAPSRSSPRG